MKKNDDDRQSLREKAEGIFYVILPILCVAAILRGFAAGGSPSREEGQQTNAGQQVVVREQDGSEPLEETDDPDQAEKETEEAISKETEAAEETTAVRKTGGKDLNSGETERKVTPRKNPYDEDNFVYSEETGKMSYSDENYESLLGIDVSEHQGEIDWKAVKEAGFDFVFIRVGFRGYGEEGTLNEDTMAVEYMKEADKAGLQIGTYFFSQAVNEEEAAEEARFAAKIIKKSGVSMNLPLVYDPELAGGSQGRANHLDREQVSANAIAFKKAAEEEIHCKVALYTNLFWENTYFDVETLNQFEIWYADYESVPQTNCHFTWWQYTETGSVPGIKGNMDLNLWIKQAG